MYNRNNVFIGLTNPQNLSFDSFLVNHSVQYTIAAVARQLPVSLKPHK